jgi:hypothetical protein
MPREFSSSTVHIHLKVQLPVDHEALTFPPLLTINEGIVSGKTLHFPWQRASNYIPHAIPLSFEKDGMRVTIAGSLDIRTTNGYIMTSHLNWAAKHDKHKEETEKMHWTNTIGTVPDAAISLGDGQVLAVNSRLLMQNSPYFAAQFSSLSNFKENTTHCVDMKAYQPLAVRALLVSIYLADTDWKRCLEPILSSSSSFSSRSSLSETQWASLADTFSLADQHAQYGLMKACMEHMTGYIPTTCLSVAKRLCRYDAQPSAQENESREDRILKEFKQRLIQHVRANIERFLEVVIH